VYISFSKFLLKNGFLVETASIFERLRPNGQTGPFRIADLGRDVLPAKDWPESFDFCFEKSTESRSKLNGDHA
jgi:hypothetical protein